MRVLVEHLGADMADTVAVGDAAVDIPMFECCGTSVCMGSGGEEAKAAADWVPRMWTMPACGTRFLTWT